jgi:hypothetical protein
MRLLRRRELLAALALGGLPGRPLAAPPQAGSAPLQLLRTGDIGGLPWIELPLQGMATRWLVDSGASAAVIAPALAERLQLRPLSPISVALAGGVQTLPRYRLPALFAGGPASETAAIGLDLQHLLGEAGGRLDGAVAAPWLHERVTRFDFAAGRLHWAPLPSAVAAAAAVLPLTGFRACRWCRWRSVRARPRASSSTPATPARCCCLRAAPQRCAASWRRCRPRRCANSAAP